MRKQSFILISGMKSIQFFEIFFKAFSLQAGSKWNSKQKGSWISICSAACAPRKDESKSKCYGLKLCKAEQKTRGRHNQSLVCCRQSFPFVSVLKWAREGEWNSAWFKLWQNRLPFHFCAQQIKSLQQEMSFHPSLKEQFTQNWIASHFFLTALSLEAIVAFSNVFFSQVKYSLQPHISESVWRKMSEVKGQNGQTSRRAQKGNSDDHQLHPRSAK